MAEIHVYLKDGSLHGEDVSITENLTSIDIFDPTDNTRTVIPMASIRYYEVTDD